MMAFLQTVPWLELTIALSLLGALIVGLTRDAHQVARRSVIFLLAALLTSIMAFIVYENKANDTNNNLTALFQIDALAAPLLPLLSLLHVITGLGTAKAKQARFAFAGLLLAQALETALLTCSTTLSTSSWIFIALLILGTLLPWLDLRNRQARQVPYLLYQGLFIVLLVIGGVLLPTSPALGGVLCLIAVFIRNGAFPFHAWLTEIFEGASMGTAMAFTLPLAGILAAIRLVIPHAPANILETASIIALLSALYGGGMAIVQHNPQRFFAYLYLSQSSLVLYGVLLHSSSGLTAALCLWISAALALAGMGFVLRSLGARFGSLSLGTHHGLYPHAPALAICFLFTGLSSVGFPGTIGFVPLELLIDGSIENGVVIALALAVIAMLNGIAVLRCYFLLFTGKRIAPSVPLPLTKQERFVVLLLAIVLFIGGIFPQFGITSRHEASNILLKIAPEANKAQSHAP
jgi:NADH-quinone oxidoreductase subunit M